MPLSDVYDVYKVPQYNVFDVYDDYDVYAVYTVYAQRHHKIVTILDASRSPTSALGSEVAL